VFWGDGLLCFEEVEALLEALLNAIGADDRLIMRGLTSKFVAIGMVPPMRGMAVIGDVLRSEVGA
jgi:hypothetical protein